MLSLPTFFAMAAAANAADSVQWQNLLVASPFAAAFLYLFLDERRDKRAIQSQYIEFMRTAIPIMERATSTIQEVVTAMRELSKDMQSRNRGQGE